MWPSLSRRKRKQEEGFTHMELRRMKIADQASEAAQTIGQLTIAAEAARSSLDPGPKFETGQSVLQWWSGWMEKAESPPMKLKKRERPAWLDATIVASLGKMSVRYAGYDWNAVYCYEVIDWNGGGEIIPEHFIMVRPPGDNPQNRHSNGKIISQPGVPEFWVPLSHTMEKK